MNITIPNAVNNKTNYSESDNALNNGMQFNCTSSWCIKLTREVFFLYPFASFEWELLDFHAQNGSGVYADAATLASNGGKPKEYETGELCDIDYKRSTIFTWIGTELVICPTDRFAFAFAFAISPYTYIESLDIHDAPEGEDKRQYIDRTNGWFSAYRFSTGASFQVSERTSIVLDVKTTFTRQLKGDTYGKTGKGGFHKDTLSSARADINCVDISFGARYRFIP